MNAELTALITRDAPARAADRLLTIESSLVRATDSSFCTPLRVAAETFAAFLLLLARTDTAAAFGVSICC